MNGAAGYTRTTTSGRVSAKPHRLFVALATFGIATMSHAAISPVLALDATYPFSLECITLQTPAGTAGKSDVAITSPAGSVTSPKAFQYLQSENFYAKPSIDKFVLYDQPRQLLYLSDIDHIDVFNLAGSFFSNLIEPPGGPPPGSRRAWPAHSSRFAGSA